VSARCKTVADINHQLGMPEQTYFSWNKEHGGLKTNHTNQLKELEQKNGRLLRVLPDAVIDDQILRDGSQKNL